MRLGFEGCLFDSDTRELSKDGRTVSLSPKAFALLELLIQDRPKAVSKEAIHGVLWPAMFVSDSSLPNLVMELRTALEDPARRPRIIRTVARFGYAFCADATAAATRARVEPPPTAAAYRLLWGPREIALNPGENLIGRDQQAVVWIDDGSVSRRHARIVIDERGATLEDLGSKNGTYWRGRRIRAARELGDKDQLKIGPASMILRVFRRTGSTLSTMKDRRAR